MPGESPVPTRRRLRQLELAHAAIAALACAVAVAVGPAAVARAIAVGALLGGLNARALASLVARVTDARSLPTGAVALIFVKMLLLLAAVAGALLWLDVQPIAFVVALTAAPLLWLIGGLLGALGPSAGAEVSR